MIGSAIHLAPAGRHVYSTQVNKYPKAPEGRHVYSTQVNKYPKAPEGRHVYPKGGT